MDDQEYELRTLLDTALVDPHVYRVYDSYIHSGLEVARFEFLKAELWGLQPSPRELYAPSQTETAKWMRKWITDAEV